MHSLFRAAEIFSRNKHILMLECDNNSWTLESFKWAILDLEIRGSNKANPTKVVWVGLTVWAGMRVFLLVVATAVLLSFTTARAAEGAGEAVAVIDAASASRQAGDRTLAAGSRAFLRELVATDAAGEAQLLFDDGTRMVVGPNSSLVIEKFVFRGKSAENQFAIRALGGTFRFISGESGDQNYSILTPTGTIGVRATAFDFTVTPGGTKLVLLEGEATLCTEGGACAAVATPCGLLRTTDGRTVEEITIGHGRVEETRGSFPLLAMQSSLLEAFRIEDHGDATIGRTGRHCRQDI